MLARAKMIKSSKVELKRDGIVDEREGGMAAGNLCRPRAYTRSHRSGPINGGRC